MVKLKYRLGDGLLAEIEEDSIKNAFAEMANLDEIFGITKCGCCGGTKLQHMKRTVDANDGPVDYYELKCQNPKCLARFSFGQKKDQKNLFPKFKKDDSDDRRRYGNGGWYKWEGTNGDSSADDVGGDVATEDEVPF